MPAQHHLFAHGVLPSLLWEGDGMLGILANPENQEYLTTIWNAVPKTPDFLAVCAGHRKQMEDPRAKQMMREMGVIPESTEQFSAVLPPDGLCYSSHWIGGEHLVFLVELPPPTQLTEAHFVCITSSPEIQYFTLEKSQTDAGRECTAFCSWTAESHFNFGSGPEPTKEAFLKKLCEHLRLPETIEQPTGPQLRGMSTHTVIDTTMPESLPEADEQQVRQWEGEAQEALKAHDLPKAEGMYRRVLDIRMQKQGPHNTLATLATMPLVQVLKLQGRHPEAETVCRKWWHACRRFRMLGHQETMLATRALADCLRAQNRAQEAVALMRYRTQLAGLARGKDSIQARAAHSDMQFFVSAAAPPAINTAATQTPTTRAWWQFWR